MQPLAVSLVGNTPQQAAGILTLKLLSGDLSALPINTVVRASVNSVANGKADLTVNGLPMTVRAQPGLTPGTELAVQVTASGVEAVIIPPSQTAAPPAPASNPPPATATTASVAAPPAPPPPPTVPQAQQPIPQAVVPPPPPTSPPPAVATPVAAQPSAQTSQPLPSTAPPPPSAAPASADSPPTQATPPQDANARGFAALTAKTEQPATAAPTVDANGRVIAAPTAKTDSPTAQPTRAQPQPTAQPARAEPQATAVSPQPLPTAVQFASRPTIPVPISLPANVVSSYAAPAAPTQQLSVVEVLPPTPTGQPQVRIDGRPPEVATSPEPLTPGTKLVAVVERTPQGVRLIPAPATDSPQVTTAVTTAILRQERPPSLPESVPPLLKELASTTTPATKTQVAQAAAEVRDAVKAVVPDSPRPLNAAELKSLVEDGGQRYEAKLARQLDGGDGPGAADLKGGLLKLFEAVPAMAHSQFPAAKATLDGIEHQQAANVLAQQTGGPFVLQVPFPDGANWRTLHLAIEPDANADREPTEGQSRPFRMLMHVPLSDLGDTWIDAGMTGDNFRAVMYLEQPAVRDRVRAELPALQAELKQSGFADVHLDVRSTADLSDRQKRTGAAMTAGVPEGASVIDVRA